MRLHRSRDGLDPTPLLQLAEARARASAPAETPTYHGLNLWDQLGTSQRQVDRWRSGQRISHLNADRLAVRIGLHPLLIWPDWWPVGPQDDTQRCPHAKPLIHKGNPHGCSPYGPQAEDVMVH